MSMLTKAVNRLRDIRKSHLSETVGYSRLGVQVIIEATRGSTGYEVFDDNGTAVRSRSTDFIFTAADLILSGSVTLPKRRDRIVITIATAVSTYEVLDLGAAGHFRPADPFGTTLRVHTKLVSQTQ